MDAALVAVAEGFDLADVQGDVLPVVAGVSLVHQALEVGAEVDVIGRVHIDEVDLSGHALVFQEGGHSALAAAFDEAVVPVAVVVAVRLEVGVGGQVVEVVEPAGLLLLRAFFEQGGDEFGGGDFVVDKEFAVADGGGVRPTLPLQAGVGLGIGFRGRDGLVQGISQAQRGFGGSEADAVDAGVFVLVDGGGWGGGGHGGGMLRVCGGWG